MSPAYSVSVRLCERTMLQCNEVIGEECDNRMELLEKLLHLRPQGMHQRWAEAEHLFTVVMDVNLWVVDAIAEELCHSGSSLRNTKFILTKCTFEFDALFKKKKSKIS